MINPILNAIALLHDMLDCLPWPIRACTSLILGMFTLSGFLSIMKETLGVGGGDD